MMQRPTVLLPVCLAAAFVAAGCDSGGARQIDTGGREVITTVDDIDIQDYLNAVDRLTDDLLARGPLSRAGADGDVFVEVDRVRNDTSRPGVDVQQLTDRMRQNILNSGQAFVLTPRGEALIGDEQRIEDEFRGNTPGDTRPTPQYFLTGRLSNVAAQAGRTRQQTFVFRMSLTDTRGVERWTNNTDITKQGRRNVVGR